MKLEIYLTEYDIATLLGIYCEDIPLLGAACRLRVRIEVSSNPSGVEVRKGLFADQAIIDGLIYNEGVKNES